MASKKYFVGGLSKSVNGDQLRDFFERGAGPVAYAIVAYDKLTGDHRGFGFVQFLSRGAERAAEAMSGTELAGRKVSVKEAQERRAG